MIVFFIISISNAYTSLLQQMNGTINQTTQIQIIIPTQFQNQIHDFDISFELQIDQKLQIYVDFLNNTNLNLTQIQSLDSSLNQSITISKSFYPQNLEFVYITLEPQIQTKYIFISYLSTLENRFLSLLDPELGFLKKSDVLSYQISMKEQISGSYILKAHYFKGNGSITLQQIGNTDEKYTDQNQITFFHNQAICYKTCNYVVQIIAEEDTHFSLQFSIHELISIQNLQLIDNQIFPIKIQNDEAKLNLYLNEQNQTNPIIFIYFDQTIEGQIISNCSYTKIDRQIMYYNKSQGILTSQENTIELLTHCIKCEQLAIQFISQRNILEINQIHTIQQQNNCYQFYQIQTVLNKVKMEINSYDNPLQLYIYVSTQKNNQFPNQFENEYEVIESNIQYITVKENIIFVGIKTKSSDFNYSISFTDTNDDNILMDQDKVDYICNKCTKEYKYLSERNESIFFNLNNSQIEMIVYEDGQFLQFQNQSSQYKVQENSVYKIILKNKNHQQYFQLKIRRNIILPLQFNQWMNNTVNQVYQIMFKPNTNIYIYLNHTTNDLQVIHNSNIHSIIQKYYNIYEIFPTNMSINQLEFSLNLQQNNQTFMIIDFDHQDPVQFMYVYMYPKQMQKQSISLKGNQLMLEQEIINLLPLPNGTFNITNSKVVLSIQLNGKTYDFQNHYIDNFTNFKKLITFESDIGYQSIDWQFNTKMYIENKILTFISVPYHYQNNEFKIFPYQIIIICVLLFLVIGFCFRRILIKNNQQNLLDQKKKQRQELTEVEIEEEVNEFDWI